jgi:CRP/FNR family transcriptional regulator, anaerobic regulatory protein
VDHGSLAERLDRYLPLVDSERRALAALEDVERAVPRGAVLCGEQSSARDLFVVRRGWLYSSMLLPEGNRQILSLHLRGDLAGDTALPWAKAPFSLTAATDVTVRVIDKVSLRRLFESQPRLAMLIHALTQAERVSLADRLASVGRTSAKSRVGALILDAHCRLRAVGEKVDGGFILPLTQEEIGDATGLTAVHVNRMMRQLAEDGLIARTGSRIRVTDEPRLATVSNHTDRLGAIDTSWLPPAPIA